MKSGNAAELKGKHMDFAYTDKVKALQAKVQRFMDEHVYPNEQRRHEEVEANRAKGNAWVPLALVEELKPKARAQGLWNLFWPKTRTAASSPTWSTRRCARSWAACTGRRRCSTAPRRTPATWKR